MTNKEPDQKIVVKAEANTVATVTTNKTSANTTTVTAVVKDPNAQKEQTATVEVSSPDPSVTVVVPRNISSNQEEETFPTLFVVSLSVVAFAMIVVMAFGGVK